MTLSNTEARLLAEVTDLIVEVIGDEPLLDGEITMDTTFTDDLALESIEFVVLAERLHQRYGDRVDFIGFLAGMDIDEIMNMTVGRLVRHIAARTTQAGNGLAMAGEPRDV